MPEREAPIRLDPLRFPLHGSRLIEASAGTGKTFTIAALYLRLMLGHGGDAAFARPLTPPQVLVVTFTDAATQELRDRIRARLAQAAAYFERSAIEIEARASADPAANGDVAADVIDAADGHAGDGHAGDAEPGAAVDPLLRALRDDHPPARWRQCARLLQAAAQQMDEAAVSTIHGWCHRMLREHAFATDSLFTQTLQTDLSDWLIDVVRDYWRVFLYPLEADDARRVRGWWAGPDRMLGVIQRLLPLHERIGASEPPARALADARHLAARRLAQLKAPWPAWLDEIGPLLDEACAKRLVFGQKFQRRHYVPWLDELRRWAGDPQAIRPGLSETGWQRLTPAGLAQVWRDGQPPAHPAWSALERLAGELDALPDGRAALLRHATAWVVERFAWEKSRRAAVGFDDLLARLDRALRGDNGRQLAALIREQFPVAMIDEFQDTDPEQYRIFDAIYRVDAGAVSGSVAGAVVEQGGAVDSQATALVLIGDPKQAIYAFRGADIHAYLAARRATRGRHYTLATNYRSTAPMVAAVNAWFELAQRDPHGRGAFLGRRGDDDVLPFHPAEARGRDERWCVDGAPAPALTCWTLPSGKVRVGTYRKTLADAAAARIAGLIALAAGDRAGFSSPDGAWRPLRPGDVAVLVNNGAEAALVRRALARVGLRSVYLSDKESVFDSPVAGDLLAWLRACADPHDDRLLRAALASAALSLDWAALDRLNDDEAYWEAQVERWRAYRAIWRRHGVLPMIRHLLHDFAVPARLLSRGDERGLTDLLHLAELLQQASATLDGEHALIRHLAEMIQTRAGGDDARRQRLESDDDLVKVVTVHKSKGLEYPLVFVPFASAFREVKPQDLPLSWHDDDGHPHVTFDGDPALVARADDERLAEDLRKFYVALTRARHAAWLGVVAIEGFPRSAPGYLLGARTDAVPADLAPLLAGADAAAIVVEPAPAAAAGPSVAVARAASPLDPPLPLRGRARPSWWIASFSALLRAGQTLAPDASDDRSALPDRAASALQQTFAEAVDERAVDASVQRTAAASAAASDDAPVVDGIDASDVIDDRGGAAAASGSRDAAGAGDAAASSSSIAPAYVHQPGLFDEPVGADASAAIHDFPRGPAPGSFLHELLEWAGRQGFGEVCAHPERVDAWLDQQCAARGWQAWRQPLRHWLIGLLERPLQLAGRTWRLADLRAGAFLVEMEFWFSARDTDLARIDRAVTRHTLRRRSRPSLGAVRLQGMLKGFIDLVFEHDGRYYVADYKSNWLGPDDAAYTASAMADAVAAHRYDLQYALYLFALHRLLKSRVPDYDYDRHVGGAVYLFVRACRSDGGGVFVERPPRALIDALDALFDKEAR